MRRLATLLFLLAAATSAEARGIGARVIYRAPAGPPTAIPWTRHPVLSRPTPLLAVSDRDTTDGTTTAEFFGRLTEGGFACLVSEPTRRRVRRAEVVCTTADGEAWSIYAGGWPVGGGVFVVDRIRVGQGGGPAELLGGARVAAHVRGVLGGDEPSSRIMTMRNAPVR